MDEIGDGSAKRRFPIGAEILPDGRTWFRVWAPNCRRVELVIPAQVARRGDEVSIALEAQANGYFTGCLPGLAAGMRYGFRLDRSDRLWPDPASRAQPDGPEGLSCLVDPGTYVWSDSMWTGVKPDGQVIYEMHIGTFTRQGTWASAASELPELARIGITMVEVMPVAEFPGEFGWGYDGVCMFAPTRLYGEPDDFRRFVDVAHRERLAVILDVVYNHFGPVNHTIPQFSKHFSSRRYANDWGDAINFDGDCSQGVREFFIANVKYWIEEFHLDGLRFDATQALHDESKNHILTELGDAARQAAGDRRVFLVAENEPQDTRTICRRDRGGHGLDGVWNDDFHHSAMVRLTGRSEAYYSDYLGTAEELLGAIKYGFIYQGQMSQWQKAPRGTPTRGLPATAFVTFLQNHDQVANSARGERIDRIASPGCLRAMTALWLLAPQTPMIFQGQEFWASAPFLYFADNTGDQARRVAAGRAEFLKQFPSIASPDAQSRLANPAERSTFERCKLDFTERQNHGQVYALHMDLLRLRRDDPVFCKQRSDGHDGATLGPDALIVRFSGNNRDDRLLLVNFGRDLKLSPVAQPLFAPQAGSSWSILWNSCEPRYGGGGTPKLEVENGWHLPGEAAVVMQSVRRAQSPAAVCREGPAP